MAFCEKCGKELAPGEVCSCESSQSSTAPQMAAASQAEAANAQAADSAQSNQSQTTGAQPVNNQSAALQAPSGDSKKTGMIIGGIVAALAVVIIIALVAVVAMGGSYKKPVNDLVKQINSQNKDPFAYQALITSPIEADYSKSVYNILKKNEDFKDEYDDAKEDIADFYEDLKGFKITKVDFVSADEMKSKDLRAIEKSYDNDYVEDMLDEIKDMDKGDYEDGADALDISVSDAKKFVKATENYLKACQKVKVSKGYEVTLRVYGKFDGDSDKTDKIKNVKVIKMNGKWYIYDASSLFRGMSFEDDLSDIQLYELYRNVSGANFSSMFSF